MLCVVPRDDDSTFAFIPLKELINHRVSQLVKQYQPDEVRNHISMFDFCNSIAFVLEITYSKNTFSCMCLL